MFLCPDWLLEQAENQPWDPAVRPFTDTAVSELAEYRRQHCMAVAVGSHHLPQLIILFGTVLGF